LLARLFVVIVHNKTEIDDIARVSPAELLAQAEAEAEEINNNDDDYDASYRTGEHQQHDDYDNPLAASVEQLMGLLLSIVCCDVNIVDVFCRGFTRFRILLCFWHQQIKETRFVVVFSLLCNKKIHCSILLFRFRFSCNTIERFYRSY
jgi:hypothetical protein